MCKYTITNINLVVFDLPSIFSKKTQNWNSFLQKENYEKTIEITYINKNQESYGLEEYMCFFACSRCIRRNSDIMLVDKDWQHAAILSLNEEESFDAFTNQIFYTHAVQQHMIQIHSSMIDYHGKGILFLGPSGIGKTTQAELWNQYRDALIINGDMNFIQETDDGFLGWGTPWHGSSPYCENTNVPVHALVILKQASENSIRELKDFEKVQKTSDNVIYPTWLENGMELCLETLDHLLTKIPVYELSCRPDEDAVKLTEETIFGK